MDGLAAVVGVSDAPAIPGLAFRTWRGEPDLAAIVEVMNAVEVADGTFEMMTVEALDNWLANRDDFEPARDLLLAEIGGRVVAVAEQLRSIRDGVRIYDTFGWVHPDWRRRGLGRAMLRHGEARLRERAVAEEAAGETRPALLGSWSLDDAIGNRTLLGSEGYRPVRWFVEMTRPDLDDIPRLGLPAGLELRPVPEDRARDVLIADSEAFQDHWGARQMSEADVRRILGEPDTDLTLWQVAWAGDEVAGSVLPMIFPANNEASGIRRGWLDRVSVRRPWRRRGVAAALMAAALEALRERGMEVASLGVDADNPSGALGLYERLGFRVDRRSAAYRKAL